MDKLLNFNRKTDKPGKIKISLVGDIFPANSHYTIGFGNGSHYINNANSEWEKHLQTVFCNSDLSFCNLEVPLIKNDTRVDESAFVGSNNFASSLKRIGINVVSIANNHILEEGAEGFNQTKNALLDSGLEAIGVNEGNLSNIYIYKKGELSIGFAGFNGINDIPNPKLYSELNIDSVYNTLEKMNSLGLNYKLLSFHWGQEYSNLPSTDQIEFAHKVIDYGADIIVGHHPHVIQPIEKYKNGLIIYSLGNFIFDFLFSKQFSTGMLVDVFLGMEGEIDFKFSKVLLEENMYVRVEQSKSFYKKIKKYNSKVEKIGSKTLKKYKGSHRFNYILNRLYQRILMKRKIIELLFFSRNRNKLVNNIMKRFKNKKNNSQ